jgi:ammonium transporter, Amt family
MSTPHSLIDIVWLLICSALVMIMHGGFCFLETGLIRSKNSINAAIKSLSDFCVSSTVFWCFGFALMFGASINGWVGTSGFFFNGNEDPWLLTFFIFQLIICGITTAIISGAVAERTRFIAYGAVATIVSGLLYPIFGHWAWGGIQFASESGWLRQLGFIDYAGSSVVHSLGGWVSLAAIILIGPRIGRYGKGTRPIQGHNLPMATLGVLLLWFGWFGFNGGGLFHASTQLPTIFLNTILAGAVGGITTLCLSWGRIGRPAIPHIMSGVLAGLVSITACCNIVTPEKSALIGGTGGAIAFYGGILLDRLQIDDAVNVIPVHAFAGVWGTLSVALFGDPNLWRESFNIWQQLGVQSLGVLTCLVWGFGGAYVSLSILNRWIPLRVSKRAELIGLNISEHHSATELRKLLTEMEAHQARSDYSKHAEVEPNTEVGQIAEQYNRVLDKVDEEITVRKKTEEELKQVNAELKDYTSTVSHDLKSPLRAVDAYSKFLEAECMSKFDDRGKTNLLDLRKSVQKMTQLITDLLKLSRISRIHNPYEPTQINALLRSVADNLKFDIREKKVVLQIQTNLPVVLCDPIKMTELFHNLMSNAIKFSAKNGAPPRVEVTYQDQENHHEFRVADNGIGIDPKFHEDVFKIFRRLHTDEEYEGSGAGLSIVKKVIDLHGGKIWIEPKVDKGTCFIFTIPKNLQPK